MLIAASGRGARRHSQAAVTASYPLGPRNARRCPRGRQTENDFVGHYFACRKLVPDNAGAIALANLTLVHGLGVEFELRFARKFHRDRVRLRLQLQAIGGDGHDLTRQGVIFVQALIVSKRQRGQKHRRRETGHQ
jgi:hypothetical protein